MEQTPPPTLFFMHIMKTAGTSFATHLVDHFPPEELYPDPTTEASVRREQYWKIAPVRAVDPATLARVRVYHGHFPFLFGELVGADETLTLLRDPVERTLSHIHHCERHFPQHRGKPPEQIYTDDWHHPLLFRNYQVKQFALTAADRPKAHNEVIEVDADRLALAQENLASVAVLGLTDRYDEFLDQVAARYGWEVRQRPRLQVGEGAAEVPDSLRDRIAEDSAMDVAFYEHACAVHAQRRADAATVAAGPGPGPEGR